MDGGKPKSHSSPQSTDHLSETESYPVVSCAVHLGSQC